MICNSILASQEMENQWIVKSLLFFFASCVSELIFRKVVVDVWYPRWLYQKDGNESVQKLRSFRTRLSQIFSMMCFTLAMFLTAVYALASQPSLLSDIINNHSESSQTALCLALGIHLWNGMDEMLNKWSGDSTNLVVLHHCGLLLMFVPALHSRKMMPLYCIGLISMVHSSMAYLTMLLKLLDSPRYQILGKCVHWANYTLRFLNWLCLYFWFLVNFQHSCQFFIGQLRLLMMLPINIKVLLAKGYYRNES